jgi:hypothetical protein
MELNEKRVKLKPYSTFVLVSAIAEKLELNIHLKILLLVVASRL